MLNPKAKRRRLDAALSRPFKSPLRKDHTTTPTNRDKGGSTVPDPASSRVKPAVSNTTTPQKLKAGGRQQTSAPPPESESESGLDDEIATLRKNRITLQSQLASLRSELETAQQALRIESSPRDEELKTLIAKWRSASQSAADELFEAAKDKIESMGGVAAWKASERERQQRAQMWEDEDFYAGVDGEGAKRDDESITATTTTTRAGRKGEQKEVGEEEVSIKLFL
jgi:hypothetical protein